MVSSSSPEPKSSGYTKNITRTEEIFEVNPRFIGNGSHIIYLEFTGDTRAPMPWDYRLLMTDRNGYSIRPLTTDGVIDYSVLPNGSEVLILTAKASSEQEVSDYNFYEEIFDWELWQLDLRTKEKELIEVSNGRPLSEGYKFLGTGALPDFNSNRMLLSSPQNTNQILVKREIHDKSAFIRFYSINQNGAQELVFSTEGFDTHCHFNWIPMIVWLNESTFITQQFESSSDSEFPQSEGSFSIVRIDLENGASKILYSSRNIKPFPKFALNETLSVLYFQKAREKDTTELCSLNLSNGTVSKIYWSESELGQVRSSPAGTSLVFTKLEKNNSDIVRLDVERYKLPRLAEN